jgi:hypothetical protein
MFAIREDRVGLLSKWLGGVAAACLMSSTIRPAMHEAGSSPPASAGQLGVRDGQRHSCAERRWMTSLAPFDVALLSGTSNLEL